MFLGGVKTTHDVSRSLCKYACKYMLQDEEYYKNGTLTEMMCICTACGGLKDAEGSNKSEESLFLRCWCTLINPCPASGPTNVCGGRRTRARHITGIRGCSGGRECTQTRGCSCRSCNFN